MDTIDGMRTFAAVAQEGSFTDAARRLGISTKLASKYVKQLEEQLDVQLLSRTTRSVSLTDVGREYLDGCAPLLEQYDELCATVRATRKELAGTIRLTAPTSFGSTKLVRAMDEFLREHQKIEIDLVLADRRASLVEESFDLAIRIGRLTSSSMIARKLMTMPLVVCASPAYLCEHPPLGDLDDLAMHTCIISTVLKEPTVWSFLQDGEERSVKIKGRLRADAPRATAELAALGLGVARCPRYVVEPYLSSGQLVELLCRYQSPKNYVYALYPPNRYLSARVRCLIDHLARALGAEENEAAADPTPPGSIAPRNLRI